MLKSFYLAHFKRKLHIRKPHYFSQNSNAKIAQTNNKTVKIYAFASVKKPQTTQITST